MNKTNNEISIEQIVESCEIPRGNFHMSDTFVTGPIDVDSEINSLAGNIVRTTELLYAANQNRIRYKGLIRKYTQRIHDDTQRVDELRKTSKSLSGYGIGRKPPDEDERQERYRKENLERIRKIVRELEGVIGLTIDFETYTGWSDTTYSMFRCSDIHNGFIDTKRIPVSKDYLTGFVFVSPFGEQSDASAINLVGQVLFDYPTSTIVHPTAIAYDRKTRKIYINEESPYRLISDGGLLHEVAHARIAQDYGPIDKIIKLKVGGDTKFILSESYEEVAAHRIAFNAARDRGLYRDIVKEKYGLGGLGTIPKVAGEGTVGFVTRHTDKDIENFLIETLQETRDNPNNLNIRPIDYIAEAVAVFSIVDPRVEQGFQRAIKKMERMFNPRELTTLHGLIDLYKGATSQNYASNLNKAAELLCNCWNIPIKRGLF